MPIRTGHHNGKVTLWRKAYRRLRSNPHWLVVVALVTLASFWACHWAGPGLPRQVVIAAGRQGGAYHRYAESLRSYLGKHGVELVVRQTAGSGENLTLLRDETQGVSLALVQGGVGTTEDNQKFRSVASVYPEPVWLFFRDSLQLEQLGDLARARVSIGEAGSGTRELATRLLVENELLGSEPPLLTVVQWNASVSAQALYEGRLDAAFFVQSADSQLIQELLAHNDIRLFEFKRGAAYVLRFPFLSQTVLPAGGLQLAANRPSADVALLAADANVVARQDLHPALVPLLVDAAHAIPAHSKLFQTSRAYPTTKGVSFPLHPDARRYFRSGPSLLFRIFPFRVAVWLDRMKVMIIPLITLLLPLFKTAPPLYRWTVRSRIYRWYGILHEVHTRLLTGQVDDVTTEWETVREMERDLIRMRVPLSYMREYYALQIHLDHVAQRLREAERQERAPLMRPRKAA